MLIYVTICDTAGRDASVLLDATRIIAVAPYTESASRPFFASLGEPRRPTNRSYLEVHTEDLCKWVVPTSEWPCIKAALVRVNGGGFNRFGNDMEVLECPHYLQTPATGAAAAHGETDAAQYHPHTPATGATTAREEAVTTEPYADEPYADTNLAAVGRELFSADAIRITGTDWGREATACSSSR